MLNRESKPPMKTPLKNPLPSLEDRIRETQEAAAAFLDSKAAEIAADSPGVPQHVISNLLRNRSFGGGCDCKAALAILAEQET
jgi:hypothetical protein